MKDMTQGNPFRQILAFMIPVFIGNLFQNLYNIVDLVIVGQFLGADALAAVGSTSSIVFLVIGWAMGLTTGFGITLAQAFGAKQEAYLKHCMATATYVCLAFAVGMTLVLLLCNDFILQTMNTPANIYSDTKGYITIIYAGLITTYLYNMLAATARALGDSKTPLYFLMLSSVLNIGLDLLFVAVLPFGVAGAGYATILAQTVAAVSCLVYVYKKYPCIRFNKEQAQWNPRTAVHMLQMGIPMALQFSITAIGTMIVQSSLNLLGSDYIAAYAGDAKIQSIIMQFPIAMGAALASYVGQNLGAGRIDRIEKGVNSAILMLAVYSIFATSFSYFIAPHAIVLFADDPTGRLVEIATQQFHTTCWYYFPLSLIFVYRNALQGLGNGFVPLLGGIGELIARALAIFFLFESLQFLGIVLADPLAWFSALVPLVPYYYWYMRRAKKQYAA